MTLPRKEQKDYNNPTDKPKLHQRDRQHPKDFERVNRIETVRNWLARGANWYVLQRKIQDKWGVNRETARRYYRRAIEWDRRVIAHLRADCEQVRASALRFFDQVLLDPNVSLKEKMSAWRQKLDVLSLIDRQITVGGELKIEGSIEMGIRNIVNEMRLDRSLREQVRNYGDIVAYGTRAGGGRSHGNGFSPHKSGENGTNGNAGGVCDPPPCGADGPTAP